MAQHSAGFCRFQVHEIFLVIKILARAIYILYCHYWSSIFTEIETIIAAFKGEKREKWKRSQGKFMTENLCTPQTEKKTRERDKREEICELWRR